MRPAASPEPRRGGEGGEGGEDRGEAQDREDGQSDRKVVEERVEAHAAHDGELDEEELEAEEAPEEPSGQRRALPRVVGPFWGRHSTRTGDRGDPRCGPRHLREALPEHCEER